MNVDMNAFLLLCLELLVPKGLRKRDLVKVFSRQGALARNMSKTELPLPI